MASISTILSDGSEYVREGLVEKWQKWIMLIVLMIVQGITMSIIPLMNGYMIRVYGNEGKRSAPEVDDFMRLFIDGWKLNLVIILYMIPAIIIALILGVFSIAPIIAGFMSSGRIDELAGILLGSIGLLVAGLVFAIITLIMYMGLVHFSRTGSMMDAFSVGEIVRKISDGVGWGTYIVMWIIIWIISMTIFVIIMGLNAIPPLGLIAGAVLAPLWVVFLGRILSSLYDNRV